MQLLDDKCGSTIIFAVPKPEICTKQGVHLLIYYEDVDQLRERLISVWCKLDQSVVNHASDEWRRRLSAGVSAEGGHLEHYL